MSKLKIAIFGYGAVGQPLASALQQGKHKVVFINESGEILNQNNFYPKYVVEKVSVYDKGESIEKTTISFPKTTEDDGCFKQLDLIFISVGYRNIGNVAKTLKARLDGLSTSPPIVFLENHLEPKKLFLKKFPDYNLEKLIFGIPDIIAYRAADNYTRSLYPFSFVLGSKKIADMLADRHFVYRSNIKTLFLQRLCSHNTAHNMLAYLGHAKGYRYINEAVKDNVLKVKMLKALNEAAYGLTKAYGISMDVQKQKIQEEVNKLLTNNFDDPILRVGRTPIKKLSKNERLVMPALLAFKVGVFPEALCEGIAYLLHYKDRGDLESLRLAKEIMANDVKYVLKKYAELESDHPITNRIAEIYTKIK